MGETEHTNEEFYRKAFPQVTGRSVLSITAMCVRYVERTLKRHMEI